MDDTTMAEAGTETLADEEIETVWALGSRASLSSASTAALDDGDTPDDDGAEDDSGGADDADDDGGEDDSSGMDDADDDA